MLEEVSLQEVLEFREEKVYRQEQLRHQYPGMTLISLLMNIPGPYKTSSSIRKAFEAGQASIEACFTYERWVLQSEEVIVKKAGYIAYFIVDSLEAERIKMAMIQIEETHPYGKLFDIDVYKPDGKSLSRTELGRPERTCLICEKNAKVCARSRAHSLEQLQLKVSHLLSPKITN